MSPFLYKWLKLSLVSLVACGFVAMAIYAFLKREEIRTAQLEPPLVEAPTQALKTRPESPGGLEFPNQDKLVFDLLEGTASTPADAVTATAAEAVAAPATGAAAASSFAAVVASPTETVTPTTVAQVNEKAPQPAATPVVKMPTVTPTQVTPPRAAPAETAEASAPKATEVAKPVASKPDEAAAAKPVGSWSVQLAAVGGQADAQATAKQLQAKFSALKPLAIRVVPAPGGQRYRVQFTGLATRAAAQSVCDKLGSQPCFPVGK
ncbi:MAG: SPOR domain-containing protein [Alphaproteobacteria bacterium]|nr:SPOR domain-containing protein [Alphaproteobacteria bacterium]